jgi:serine/threonine protein kinase
VGLTPLATNDPPQIAGYRLLGRLGSGGQGVVYQAQADGAGPVAVKALHAEWLAEPTARTRLAKEVAAARRVAPFCTARVLEANLDSEQPFVVSEFIPGDSLSEHVRAHGPVSGTTLDRLAVGTMTALLAIHQAGLVHRDLKPSNVILGPDGPRVVDFGIARDLDGQLTGTGNLIGTPAFMAPEQVHGQPLTPAADLFSWAVTMVYAATGNSPFEAAQLTASLYRVVSASVDLSGVPTPLAGVLEGCLAKDPAARPSAQQVLLHLVGGPSATATATPTDGTQALLAHAATLVASPLAPTLSSQPGFPQQQAPMAPTAGPVPVHGPGLYPPPYPATPPPSSRLGAHPSSPQSPAAQQSAQPPAARRRLRGRFATDGRRRGWSVALAFLLAVGGGLSLLAGTGLVVWDRMLAPPPPPLAVGTGPRIPASSGTWTGGRLSAAPRW